MPKKVKVSELVRQFQLEIIAGEDGLKRAITVDDLYRPGLEMAGYFHYHPSERIQLLGRTEISFLSMLASEERQERMERLCNEDTPCIILTRGLEAPQSGRYDHSLQPHYRFSGAQACSDSDDSRRIGRRIRRWHADHGRQRDWQKRDSAGAG
jgi:hypothetical protein